MLILISSGAQRRYADDIVRALAHPPGTEFQFRYGSQYVEQGLRDQIVGGAVEDTSALICYLSADKTAGTATLIPVRFVSIAAVRLLGTSCILTLSAGTFVTGLDDVGLRARMRPSEAARLPRFSAGSAYPKGDFAFAIAADLAGDPAHAVPGGKDIAAFEATAEALSVDEAFGAASKRAFFTVRDITTTDHWLWAKARRDVVALKEGRYPLKSGRRYVAEVYSFTPSGGAAPAGAARLGIDSDEKDIRFTSSKAAVLDSRYDLHRFAFATDQRVLGMPAGLSFALHLPGESDPKQVEQRCDITLETRFAGSFWLAAARTVVIGLGTALPALIAGIKSGTGAASLSAGTILLMLLGGCVAGLGTVIPSLRKS